MRMYKILCASLIMVVMGPNLFGQWIWSTYSDDLGFIDKAVICFISPDTGYIACSKYDDDFSLNYQTTDSGMTWSIIDTTFDFNVNDLDFKYGWGLSCGSSGEDAAMELIDRKWDNRNKIKFIEYNDIDQINIVDSTHAVFLGVTKDTNYSIGLIEKNAGQIQVARQNVIGRNKINKIDFFNDSTGYFWINKSLYITYDLGQTNETIGSNVGSFDFFSLDTGIYINYSRNLFKTDTRGNSWEMVGEWVGVELGVLSVMNSSRSLYFITYWEGTSPRSTLVYINLNSGYSFSKTYDHGHLVPVWDFYFHSIDQGYCASNFGGLLSTNNNGGHTGINPSVAEYQDISIYPNPTKDQFKIEYPIHLSHAKKLLWIIDLNGRKVKQYTILNLDDNSTIDITNLDGGVYFVFVLIKNKIFKQKILKL